MIQLNTNRKLVSRVFLSSNICRLNSNNIPQDIQNSIENNEEKSPNKFSIKNCAQAQIIIKTKPALRQVNIFWNL